MSFKGVLLGGGIGDSTMPINYEKNPDKFALKLVYDSSFHLLVIITMLNILLGIIIDTFA